MNQRIHYTEHGIEFRELVTPEELAAAYHFRYQICVERLRWVTGDPGLQQEYDQWDLQDNGVWHFGAFMDGQLIGYVRLVRDSLRHDIMSRACFSELFRRRAPRPPMEETGDISRLIFRPGLRHDKKLFFHVASNLYRMAYGRTRLEGIRYWYFVTSFEEIMALWAKELFPVKTLGHGITSDGKKTYVASLNLGHAKLVLELCLRHRRLAWYEDVVKLLEPIPVPAPSNDPLRLASDHPPLAA